MSSELERQARYEATSLGVLRRQFTKYKPLSTNVRLNDALAIVTGSNVGLGLEASRQLLKLGLPHLIMGVRSQDKGNKAAEALRKDFPQATISVWLVDMQSYDSVRKFADRCATLQRIDIAILNAAIAPDQTFTPAAHTGHELSMQVNYLSTALLSILLLPILRAKKQPSLGAKPPVLSIVGSGTAYGAEINTEGPVLAQFDDPQSFDALSTYGNTKLLVHMFTSKLAQFVSPDDIIINVVNPGLTAGTNLMRSMPLILTMAISVVKGFMARSLEVGASTYVDAVVVRGKESHGRFLSDWAIKP